MNKELLRQKPFYLNDDKIKWVEDTLSSLSPEDKVGQIFCIHLHDGTDEELERNLGVMNFGSCMFRPILRSDQVAEYIEKVNALLPVPALFAANLERGGDGLMSDGTYFASEMEVAATRNSEMAKKLGEICGTEASAVGANWAFAPIIDIDKNFRNPITNTRTFGSDPEIVGQFGEIYVQTIQQYGVAACIKHFPGDGMDERDQHLVTSINSSSAEEWDATYGRVYKRCIEAGALSVMVGHIMLPAYERVFCPDIKDEDIMPGSLSHNIMKKLLRDKLGFNGLIVTDATTMAGYTLAMPRNKAVPTSIQNGADVFLFSRNFEEDYKYMLEGVKSGLLSRERLDEAVTRVLAMKAALGLDKNVYVSEGRHYDTVGSTEHIEWSRQCADEAITLVKAEDGVLPLSPEKYKRILLFPVQPKPGGAGQYIVTDGVMDDIIARLRAEGFSVHKYRPTKVREGELPSYKKMIGRYDLMLYIANVRTKSNQTTVRIEWAQPMGANCMHYMHDVPTIFVSLENPYHLLDVPRVKTYINTYSSNSRCREMLIEKLMGRSPFRGTNPVDPFCGMWDTKL